MLMFDQAIQGQGDAVRKHKGEPEVRGAFGGSQQFQILFFAVPFVGVIPIERTQVASKYRGPEKFKIY
jgi:hypothetical protein